MNKDHLVSKINSLSKRFTQYLKEILPQLNQTTKSAPEAKKTTDAILHVLRSFGLAGRRIKKSGVIAQLQGSPPLPTSVLLLNLYPLSTNEIQNISFNSHEAGVKHIGECEVFSVIGLGVIWVLNQLIKELSGCVQVVFQTVPEMTPSVFTDLINKEVVDNVKAMYELRLDSSMPVERVGVNFGAILASTDSFFLMIHGKGSQTHHSQLIVDYIQIAAQVVTALKQLTSRKVDPVRCGFIGIQSIHGGDNDSAVPAAVKLTGTIHAVDEDVRKQLPSLIETTIQGITDAYGCDYHLKIVSGSPIVASDKNVTTNLKKSAEEILGKDKVTIINYPKMVTENHAQFLRYLPGSFVHLGTGSVENTHQNLRTSNFDLCERCIEVGVKTLSWALLNFPKENSTEVQ